MTIKRDLVNSSLNISMTGYIEKMANEIELVKNKKVSKLPIIYTLPRYPSTPQMEFIDDSPLRHPNKRKMSNESQAS